MHIFILLMILFRVSCYRILIYLRESFMLDYNNIDACGKMIFTKDDCGVKEAYGVQYVRSILMMEVLEL